MDIQEAASLAIGGNSSSGNEGHGGRRRGTGTGITRSRARVPLGAAGQRETESVGQRCPELRAVTELHRSPPVEISAMRQSANRSWGGKFLIAWPREPRPNDSRIRRAPEKWY